MDEVCSFCRQRNLECIKVWGPVKATKQINHNTTIAPFPVPRLSANAAPLFPEESLAYRLFYDDLRSSQLEGVVSVVLRHIWIQKGLALESDALVSAIVAVIADTMAQSSRWTTSHGREVSIRRHSYLRRALVKSIQKQNLSEDHLFAIFLAKHSHFLEFKDIWPHILGFEAVVRFLIDKSPNGHCPFSSPYILTYMIVEVQRSAVSYCGNISASEICQLVSNLDDLLGRVQSRSRSLTLLMDSVSLSFPFGNLELLGGLLHVLAQIQVHLFQVAEGMAKASRINDQNAHEKEYVVIKALHAAEESLDLLKSSTVTKEVFERVWSLKRNI
jgi:hypothetical protein